MFFTGTPCGQFRIMCLSCIPPHGNFTVARGRQTSRQLIIYSVLLILTRGRDLSRSANAVSAGNRKFSLPLSHLAPSLGVTPFEFMEKLYGS